MKERCMKWRNGEVKTDRMRNRMKDVEEKSLKDERMNEKTGKG